MSHHALLKVGRIGAKAGAGIHLAGVYLIAFSVACGRAVFDTIALSVACGRDVLDSVFSRISRCGRRGSCVTAVTK